MVPSVVVIPNGHAGYESEIPSINRDYWEVFYRYKTAQECADGLRFLLSHFDALSKFAQQTHQSVGNVQETDRWRRSFRDDDPRLKVN
jgi:hypothetical protein